MANAPLYVDPPATKNQRLNRKEFASAFAHERIAAFDRYKPIVPRNAATYVSPARVWSPSNLCQSSPFTRFDLAGLTKFLFPGKLLTHLPHALVACAWKPSSCCDDCGPATETAMAAVDPVHGRPRVRHTLNSSCFTSPPGSIRSWIRIKVVKRRGCNAARWRRWCARERFGDTLSQAHWIQWARHSSTQRGGTEAADETARNASSATTWRQRRRRLLTSTDNDVPTLLLPLPMVLLPRPAAGIA